MTEQITLRLEPRTVLGKKVKQLRRAGVTPVHLYGPGIPSQPLQGPSADLVRVLARAGRNTPILLTVAGSNTTDLAMVRNIQWEPVRREPLHVDLLRVEATQIISAEVPLVFKGQSPAAQQVNGMVAQRLYRVEVAARPMDLPRELEVDLTLLTDPEAALRAGDVALPPNVALVTAPEVIVATIEVAREEEAPAEEAEEVAAAPSAEPEVIRPTRAEEEAEGTERR